MRVEGAQDEGMTKPWNAPAALGTTAAAVTNHGLQIVTVTCISIDSCCPYGVTYKTPDGKLQYDYCAVDQINVCSIAEAMAELAG